MRKAYEVFADTLAANGIRDVFGLMGDANMQYLASLVERGLGTFHAAAHEATGVSMADGWSRMSGRLGVASVTHGPGLTNAVTALKEAVEAHSRLLLITGETVPARARLQAFDVEQLVQPTGAGYERVYAADTVAADLNRAITRVYAESRPIVLNFPSALIAAPTTATASAAALPVRTVPAAEAALEAAAARVRQLRRPLIVAGMGAVRSGARTAILELAATLGATLGTTLLAKGYFDGAPGDIGVVGGLTTGAAKAVIEGADGIIAFGAALNRFTASHDDRIFVGKTIIQIDTNATAFGAATPVDVALLGDAKATAEALGLLLAGTKGAAWAEQQLAALRDEDPWLQYVEADANAGVGLTSAQVTRALAAALPADKTVVSDLGRFITAPWRHLHVATPGAFTHTGAFGSIGLGLGTALGAATATPERPTVLIVGDGALMMGVQELATGSRLGLPLIVVVFNDGAYGAEYSKLDAFGHDPVHSLTQWPDLATVARAFGARAATVTSLDELEAAVHEALMPSTAPFLIDVHIDPIVDYTEWHLPSDDAAERAASAPRTGLSSERSTTWNSVSSCR